MAEPTESPRVAMRDATEKDAMALAQVAIMAGHGVMTLLYDSLIPGKSLTETVVDRRILKPESISALRHWRVAQDASRTMLGALNSFPHHVLAEADSDPLLDERRLEPLAELSELEALTTDTYYINMIAVFPEHRGSGAGRALMAEAERLARQNRCKAISLCTFEGDSGLMSFYRKLGFAIRERRPVRSHPALGFAGNWILMMRELVD